MTFGLRIVCESAEMRASATVTCRLSAMRNVFVGGLLRNSSPEPPLVRPSHSVMVTVAGRLSATHTDTSLGSTRRRIGPARTKGSDTKSPRTCAAENWPRAFSWCCGSSAGNLRCATSLLWRLPERRAQHSNESGLQSSGQDLPQFAGYPALCAERPPSRQHRIRQWPRLDTHVRKPGLANALESRGSQPTFRRR